MATGFSSRSELESLEGKTGSTGGWFKRISRWIKARKRSLADRKLKRHLKRLEKERLLEKTALTEQRRLYERLFRRRIKDSASEQQKPLQKFEATVTNETTPKTKIAPPAVTVRKMPETPLPPLPPKAPVPPVPLVPQPPLAAPLILTEPEWMESAAQPAPQEITAEDFAAKQAEAEKASVSLPIVPAAPHAPVAAEITQAPSAGFFSNLFKKTSHTLAEKLSREREEELIWQEKNDVEKRFWQPYKGVKPNLIKDQGTVFFNWHEHLLILALSLVMCCLAIGLVYVGLLIWQKERLDNNRTTVLNTRVIEAEIAKSESDVSEVADFNDKLKAVSGLLDNHVYWTNFLTFLEDNTLKEVYYEKFTGDLTGKYAIPAVARNLESISLQLEVLKAHEKTADVSYDTGQGRPSSSTVRFNLGLTVDPTLFMK